MEKELTEILSERGLTIKSTFTGGVLVQNDNISLTLPNGSSEVETKVLLYKAHETFEEELEDSLIYFCSLQAKNEPLYVENYNSDTDDYDHALTLKNARYSVYTGKGIVAFKEKKKIYKVSFFDNECELHQSTFFSKANDEKDIIEDFVAKEIREKEAGKCNILTVAYDRERNTVMCQNPQGEIVKIYYGFKII